MTVRDAHEVEARIRGAIIQAKKEVKEVRVHMHALEDGQNVKGNGGPC